ncbi:MAG TPA: histidine phosphatase family protein [Hyphomicrobiaceae bacterium]|jgi:probable phosphoglycerate mutase|nr:histidine phosphatase family protein [Hyphomicrobiaceae bacterium]
MLKAGVTLYYLRHGETDWNLAQRYQGQRDIPINATGRTQAKDNGRLLAATLGDRAADLDYVASPLKRASETMQILRAAMGLDSRAYRTDDRLMEINYGSWEGQPWGDIAVHDPAGSAARQADVWNWRPQGGESYRMLAERVSAWVGEVAADTVVVAHGGVSRALRAVLFGLSAPEVMRLEVPQDRILVIETGAMRWLRPHGEMAARA